MKSQNEMFLIAKKMFKLNFSRIENSHFQLGEEMYSYEVHDNEKQVIGHIVFDVLKRGNKRSTL